jgi:predicted transposase YbfD/YdcC
VSADRPPELALQWYKTIDGDHGRIETRRHIVCHSIEWLFSERRYLGEFTFPGLVAAGMIESEKERGNVMGKERRYYLCSSKLEAEAFARVVRGHWGVRTACSGRWTLCSMMTSPACAPRHGPAIWQSSSMWL